MTSPVQSKEGCIVDKNESRNTIKSQVQRDSQSRLLATQVSSKANDVQLAADKHKTDTDSDTISIKSTSDIPLDNIKTKIKQMNEETLAYTSYTGSKQDLKHSEV